MASVPAPPLPRRARWRLVPPTCALAGVREPLCKTRRAALAHHDAAATLRTHLSPCQSPAISPSSCSPVRLTHTMPLCSRPLCTRTHTHPCAAAASTWQKRRSRPTVADAPYAAMPSNKTCMGLHGALLHAAFALLSRLGLPFHPLLA
ncbi:hypothetical protein ACJBU6_05459 [Exserohilum turcicum]